MPYVSVVSRGALASTLAFSPYTKTHTFQVPVSINCHRSPPQTLPNSKVSSAARYPVKVDHIRDMLSADRTLMHSMDLTQRSKSPVYHPPRHLQAKKGRTDRRPAPSLTASSWLKPGYHYLPELFLVYVVATSGCASGKSNERAQEGQNLGFDPVQRAGLALGAF
jgi:hypothetical protein